MTAQKKLSKRAERRSRDRQAEKLGKDLGRLAKLAPGGAPDRPIAVSTAAEVEVHARGVPCGFCDASVRVLEHEAETIGGVMLRVVRGECSGCRRERSLYFRVGAAPAN